MIESIIPNEYWFKTILTVIVLSFLVIYLIYDSKRVSKRIKKEKIENQKRVDAALPNRVIPVPQDIHEEFDRIFDILASYKIVNMDQFDLHQFHEHLDKTGLWGTDGGIKLNFYHIITGLNEFRHYLSPDLRDNPLEQFYSRLEIIPKTSARNELGFNSILKRMVKMSDGALTLDDINQLLTAYDPELTLDRNLTFYEDGQECFLPTKFLSWSVFEQVGDLMKQKGNGLRFAFTNTESGFPWMICIYENELEPLNIKLGVHYPKFIWLETK